MEIGLPRKCSLQDIKHTMSKRRSASKYVFMSSDFCSYFLNKLKKNSNSNFNLLILCQRFNVSQFNPIIVGSKVGCVSKGYMKEGLRTTDESFVGKLVSNKENVVKVHFVFSLASAKE